MIAPRAMPEQCAQGPGDVAPEPRHLGRHHALPDVGLAALGAGLDPLRLVHLEAVVWHHADHVLSILGSTVCATQHDDERERRGWTS
jgi:hypothetical protein